MALILTNIIQSMTLNNIQEISADTWIMLMPAVYCNIRAL